MASQDRRWPTILRRVVATVRMANYSKTILPPKNQPYLALPDGVKYWLSKPDRHEGRLRSVLTEDPSIAIHEYRGAGIRDPLRTYLFRYQGTDIGFVTHGLDENGEPIATPKADPIDVGERIGCYLITYVGTPVYDYAYRFLRDPLTGTIQRDEAGHPKKDRTKSYKDAWVTGFDWQDYAKGRRGKFPSRLVQERMVAIWPALFNGLIGELNEIAPSYVGILPDGTRAWRQRMRFADSVLLSFETGRLIET